MNYLGVDYGEKRIGLSYADELGIAVPIPAAMGKSKWDIIASVIKERKVDELVVGYPFNMDGTIGFKAKEVDVFIKDLEKRYSLPVHRFDERLSSHQAEMDMEVMGIGRKKKSIKARQEARRTGELDSRAAAIILQDFLSEGGH